ISTPEVDQMGVSDLVFAELAARDDLELVERGELAKVLAEQELQRLRAQKQALESRKWVRLGKRLGGL
ncbi:MAG: hypothetical protein ABI824_11910, partial [Acidobacteriota bacterium]